MNLKELIEKRNTLNEQAKTMLDTAQVEVRSLSSDEEAEFNALVTEVENLDAEISQLEKESMQNATEVVTSEERGNEMENVKDLEVRALDQYIRKTDGEELRAMTTGANSGAPLVPTHLYDEIVEKLEEVAPIFSQVRKLTPVSGTLEILKESSIGGAGFVGELEDLKLEDFKLGKVKLEQRRAGSAVQLSQHLINDSGIDVVAYAKEVLYRRLGYALDRVMITGTKADGQFEGLVNAPTSCNVTTTATGGVSIDDFINALNGLHPTMQNGAVWIMSRPLFNMISLIKDAVGNYYVTRQNNIVDNAPVYRLLGLPILINDAVESTLATGNKVVFLANIEKAYAGMIKKDIEFKHIDGDTANALRGSATLMLDLYADCVIKDEQAIKTIVVK